MNNLKTVLTVKNLVKTFDSGFFKKEQFTAVNNISFELKSGEILGILGPNGAGKTTTIQMLLDLLTPTSGNINYFGKNFPECKSDVMNKISFASAYLKLPGSLTVQENLDVYGKIYNLNSQERKELIEKNIKFFGLEKIKNKQAKNLSAGQLTRLMLAKAFLPRPRIVLLDEPTAALDPDIAMQIRKFILQEREKSGISMIFTSHNMAEVEELCDRVLILKEGKIIASDTPKKLAATVKTCHLQFIISKNLDKLVAYINEKKLSHKINDSFVEIDISEQEIPNLLSDMSSSEIKYSQISIEKPTLEDYFLEILK